MHDASLDLVKGYAIAAVIASVALLEFSVNELFDDALDDVLGGISEHHMAQLGQIARLQSLRSLSTLDRMQLVLVTARLSPLDEGERPFQDASALIALRNHLVHAHVDWAVVPASRYQEEREKLERQLRSLFPENQLLSSSPYPYLPDRCLGAGCADWAATCSIHLLREFFSRLGLHEFSPPVRRCNGNPSLPKRLTTH